MPLQNIRPLRILWQEGIEKEILFGVDCGIYRVLLTAEIIQEIKLELIYQSRQPDFLNEDGTLNPHKSLDWNIQFAREQNKLSGHLNSTALLNSRQDDPNYKKESGYELIVVKEPMHWSETSTRAVLGIGRQNHGAVISTHYHTEVFQKANKKTTADKRKISNTLRRSIQLLTMHELGHVFGLFPGTSSQNPTDEELKSNHCQNNCVMYWQETDDLFDKIINRPFCPSCLENLKRFFTAP